MDYDIEYSEEKNQILKETRGISFEDIKSAIEQDKVLGNIKHYNQKKYPKQRILILKIKNYIYAVPYVIKNKKTIFLKTIYPNRKLNKKYGK